MNLVSLSRKAHYTLIGAFGFAVVSAFLYWSGAQEVEVESGVYRILNFENRKHTRGSTGTGFKVAEPGFVVTNHHVIEGARELFSQYQNEDGDVKSVAMRVVWLDKQQDIAVLRSLSDLPGAVLSLAEIGQEDLLKKDSVEAIGYPGAADDLAKVSANYSMSDAAAAMIDATVTTGTVQRQVPSATRLTIQHSANVNSGNSGGPLLDSCQRVIGVNTLSQVASLHIGSIARAFKGDGVVQFQTPGALESSVHVREVLAALKEENIAPVVSQGRCRSGFTPTELWSFGLSTAASFAFFTLTGIAVVSRGRRYGIGDYPSNEVAAFSETDNAQIDYTVLADPSDLSIVPSEARQLFLKASADGRVYNLGDFEERFDSVGVVLGRAGGDADVQLKDETVSRRHALIRRHPNGNYVVSDLNSTNGTLLDGHALEGSSARTLNDGANLILGSCELKFQMEVQAQPAVPSETIAHDWLLSGFDAAGKVFQFQISGDAGQVGRSGDNDYVIDHPSISRHHAMFSIDPSGGLFVRDLGSSNGTFFKGNRIGSKWLEIESGAELQFGELFATVTHIYR